MTAPWPIRTPEGKPRCTNCGGTGLDTPGPAHQETGDRTVCGCGRCGGTGAEPDRRAGDEEG